MHARFEGKLFERARQRRAARVASGLRIEQLGAHRLLQLRQRTHIGYRLTGMVEHHEGVERKAISQAVDARIHDGQIQAVETGREHGE